MIRNILSLSKQGYLNIFLRYNKSNTTHSSQNEGSLSSKINFARNLSEVRQIFQQNEQFFTIEVYSSMCRKIPRTLQRVQTFSKVEQKHFIMKVFRDIMKINPHQLQINHIESFLFCYRILSQKKYNSKDFEIYLKDILGTQAMNSQIKQLNLRRIANLYYEICKLSFINIKITEELIYRLDTLIQQLRNKKTIPRQQYDEAITFSIMKILQGLSSGNLITMKQIVQAKVFQLLLLVHQLIMPIQLTKIVLYLQSSHLRNQIRKNGDIFNQIQKKILDSVDQLDISTIFFVLQRNSQGKLSGKLNVSILNHLFNIIDENGIASIDIIFMLKFLRLLSEKGVRLNFQKQEKFIKYIANAIKQQPQKFNLLNQSLAHMLTAPNFVKKGFLDKLSEIIMSNNSLNWHLELLHNMLMNGVNVTQLLKINRNTNTESINLDFVLLAIMVQKIDNKDPQIYAWKSQIIEKLKNCTSIQFQNLIKFNKQYMSSFDYFYRKYYEQKIKEGLKDQILQSFCFQYVVKFYSFKQQNQMLKNSNINNLQHLNKFALMFVQHMTLNKEFLPNFFNRIRYDFKNCDKLPAIVTNINKVLISSQLGSLLTPNNEQIVNSYTLLLEKILDPLSQWPSSMIIIFLTNSKILSIYKSSQNYFRILRIFANIYLINQDQRTKWCLFKQLYQNNLLSHQLQIKMYKWIRKNNVPHKLKKINIDSELNKPYQIAHYISLNKKLSSKQVKFIIQNMEKAAVTSLIEILYQFNLQKSDGALKIFQKCVSLIQSKKISIQLLNKIPTLIHNMKNLLLKQYPKQLIIRVMKKLLPYFKSTNVEKPLFMENRLLLLEMSIILNIKPQISTELQEDMIKNYKYQTELWQHVRTYNIFRALNWKIPQRLIKKCQHTTNVGKILYAKLLCLEILENPEKEISYAVKKYQENNNQIDPLIIKYINSKIPSLRLKQSENQSKSQNQSDLLELFDKLKEYKSLKIESKKVANCTIYYTNNNINFVLLNHSSILNREQIAQVLGLKPVQTYIIPPEASIFQVINLIRKSLSQTYQNQFNKWVEQNL